MVGRVSSKGTHTLPFLLHSFLQANPCAASSRTTSCRGRCSRRRTPSWTATCTCRSAPALRLPARAPSCSSAVTWQCFACALSGYDEPHPAARATTIGLACGNVTVLLRLLRNDSPLPSLKGIPASVFTSCVSCSPVSHLHAWFLLLEGTGASPVFGIVACTRAITSRDRIHCRHHAVAVEEVATHRWDA